MRWAVFERSRVGLLQRFGGFGLLAAAGFKLKGEPAFDIVAAGHVFLGLLQRFGGRGALGGELSAAAPAAPAWVRSASSWVWQAEREDSRLAACTLQAVATSCWRAIAGVEHILPLPLCSACCSSALSRPRRPARLLVRFGDGGTQRLDRGFVLGRFGFNSFCAFACACPFGLGLGRSGRGRVRSRCAKRPGRCPGRRRLRSARGCRRSPAQRRA